MQINKFQIKFCKHRYFSNLIKKNLIVVLKSGVFDGSKSFDLISVKIYINYYKELKLMIENYYFLS